MWLRRGDRGRGSKACVLVQAYPKKCCVFVIDTLLCFDLLSVCGRGGRYVIEGKHMAGLNHGIPNGSSS